MGISEEIGQQIRAARMARGLTLREAAPLCGVSFQMLGQIEHGQNTTVDRLAAIAAGLGATLQVQTTSGSGVHVPPIPADRRAIADRFLAILPVVPQEELDVLLHQVAIWERRHGRQQGE